MAFGQDYEKVFAVFCRISFEDRIVEEDSKKRKCVLTDKSRVVFEYDRNVF